jgi:exodeoxyribonuclease VII large subunit
VNVTDTDVGQKIYSVSELNAQIKTVLEDRFPFVWITGEISNLRTPASGHCYFTLKDELSQINAILFRGQQRQLRFEPEDGMNVIGLGRVSVYEPRGTYQIILEYLEPAGIGALQIAYEKLKAKLAAEGLFDPQHKKPLPFLPRKIAVITSPTGAVIHDIIRVVERRFSNVSIQVIPVKVQGDGADLEITEALRIANDLCQADVAILARGGGSLEDLQAFNSESVARAIFASRIPIVSAVGHETDFTIADFVADLRAPTPSAAAELVVPVKVELERRYSDLSLSLRSSIHRYISELRIRVEELRHRVADPKKRVQDCRLRLDDFSARLVRVIGSMLTWKTERLNGWSERLHLASPSQSLEKLKKQVDKNNRKLLTSWVIFRNEKMSRVREQSAKLEALNPLAILERGYSITRIIPQAVVVRDPAQVSLNQDLEVIVARGSLLCQVKGKAPDGKKDV